MEKYFIVFQTLFIYLFLAFIFYKQGKKTARTNKLKYVIYVVLVYSIIFGLRYGVGTDTMAYVRQYNWVLAGYMSPDSEIGFNFISSLFSSLGLPSPIFLGFFAFAQLFFVVISMKENKPVIPYCLLTFMLCVTFISFCNGIRQELAFSIFLVSITYAMRRKWLQYLFFIIIASLFHKSALLLFILLPFFYINKDFTPSLKIQYLLLFSAILIGQSNIVGAMMEHISAISTSFGYDHYLEEQYSFLFEGDKESLGIGYFIWLILAICIIYFSYDLKGKNRKFSLLYNLYFFGVLYKYCFISSSLLLRINYYFYGFEFIILGYILYDLHIRRRKEYYYLFSLVCLLFVANMYRMFTNYSAFYFNWQKDLFDSFSEKILF